MIVLFTGKDSLEHENKTLSEYIKSTPSEIQDVIEKCAGRCVAFNNYCAKEEDNTEQVKELLDMVKNTVKGNGGKCFVSDLQKDLNQLVSPEDLFNPDLFRDKVLKEDATGESSWMWQAIKAVAKAFGFEI